MSIKIKTSEAPDIAKAEANVQDVQEEARQAEEEKKQLELLLKQAQEAAERRDKERQEAGSIEKEIGEVSGA